MTLTPYDLRKLEGWYKVTSNEAIIKEFINSDYDCARVDNYPQRNANTCANSLREAVKRYHYNNIIVTVRKGEVFLIKKNTNR